MAVGRAAFLEAMLDLVFTHGSEAVSVDQIVERAGADHEDFDALFSSKQECELALIEDIAGNCLSVCQRAFDGEAVWPDSLRASAYALAGWIVANPEKTRVAMVEILGAGDFPLAVRDNLARRFIALVDGGRTVAKDADAVPAFTAEATIGSIMEMLTRRLQRGEDPDPYAFVSELMYLAVRPYLGEEAAQRELTIPPPPRAKGD